MTGAAARRNHAAAAALPALLGIASVIMFFAFAELIIRADWVSRFIVPPPSEVVVAIGRIVIEEHIAHRFLLTAAECLTAGVMITIFGIAGGVLLHRFELL